MGLVVGFASFWAASSGFAWQTLKDRHFLATSRGGLSAQVGFRVAYLSSESQKRRRGPLGGAPAPAPGGAAHALNHSLGLHSISKRWCE